MQNVQEASTSPDEAQWNGLSDAEKARFVYELCALGTSFVTPLFAVIDNIEKALRERNALPALERPVSEKSYLARYRFIRSIPGMNIDELRAVQTAMDIFSRDEDRIPTPEEFDASVDAGMAAFAALSQSPVIEGGAA